MPIMEVCGINKEMLCVENEFNILENNYKVLEHNGYSVWCVKNLAQAREHLSKHVPNVIAAEISLPDGSGLDLLEELRERGCSIPVLLLTAQNNPSDIIHVLRAGANDCVSSLVDFEVLLARVERMLRDAERVPDRVTCGELSLDILSGQAFINGIDMMLKPKEFALLLLFILNENRTVSAEYLYEKVWGYPMIDNKNSLQTIVSRLRRKLEVAGYFIDVSYGNGYTFNPKKETIQA